MWGTGMLFFLITFIEQNLWQIPWFRQSFLQEVTVQWKANGSMVGAWNQMIYGTAFYLMVKISGNKEMAFNKKSIVFYFLGFANLLFNWGHHLYNLPTHNWMRHVAYIISMTEWILLINIIQGFKKTLSDVNRFKHLITYRFLIASEFWVFLNLILALFMSIPAINRYTHGTHVTVAHAMGTTIGINSMILFAACFEFIGSKPVSFRPGVRLLNIFFWTGQAALFVFWLSLNIAGVKKGIWQMSEHQPPFGKMMEGLRVWFGLFAFSGLVLAVALSLFGFTLLRSYAVGRSLTDEAPGKQREKITAV